MSNFEITTILGVVLVSVSVTSFLSVLFIKFGLSRSYDRTATGQTAFDTFFLFKNELLIDFDRASAAVTWQCNEVPEHLDTFIDLFTERFPDLRERVNHAVKAGEAGYVEAVAEGDLAKLDIQPRGSALRLSLHDPALSSFERHMSARLLDRALNWSKASELAPYPIWQTQKDGNIIDANRKYAELQDAYDMQRPLFAVPDSEPVHRLALEGNNVPTRWFDLTTQNNGDVRYHYTIDQTDIVKAEESLRNFTQVLTKTFAQLSIGLAIFDNARTLALFNPALTELTKLSPNFLSSRPHILSVFDRLRDNGIMPEPKDYDTWRRKLEVLVAAASERHHVETWTVANGMTYRVSGRPHEDGGIAFVFEDISSEVIRERKMRAERALYNEILDGLDEAIVVFSASGKLLLSNRSYQRLWDIRADEVVTADASVNDVLLLWKEKCAPTGNWGEIRNFLTAPCERGGWDCNLLKRDGENLLCRLIPISGGISMVIFAPTHFQTNPSFDLDIEYQPS